MLAATLSQPDNLNFPQKQVMMRRKEEATMLSKLSTKNAFNRRISRGKNRSTDNEHMIS